MSRSRIIDFLPARNRLRPLDGPWRGFDRRRRAGRRAPAERIGPAVPESVELVQAEAAGRRRMTRARVAGVEVLQTPGADMPAAIREAAEELATMPDVAGFAMVAISRDDDVRTHHNPGKKADITLAGAVGVLREMVLARRMAHWHEAQQ